MRRRGALDGWIQTAHVRRSVTQNQPFTSKLYVTIENLCVRGPRGTLKKDREARSRTRHVDCKDRAETALHIYCVRAGHFVDQSAGYRADADRHLPGDQHSRYQRCMAVLRAVAARDGPPHRIEL